jgi:hypothetical protein
MVEENFEPLKVQPEENVAKGNSKEALKFLPVFLLIIFLAVGSGFGLAKILNKGGSVSGLKDTLGKAGEKKGNLAAGTVLGRTDGVFKDTAVGVVEKNDNGGEGTHRLLREGGESQTVNLTSSVVDLEEFVGYKVEVKGETFAAQKAGWLMDVGVVKILE